ncbi:hypothetical protein MFLAVUS_003318 [Mucor flavus]|uniref:Uncharacterized protein n=1 Tax=Mucor flavus TaxID=439312 RepID=A0ABP9YSS2_9FUNG
MTQLSSEIKYKMVTINGNTVSIPYIRLATGQWVPLQHQSYYIQQEQQQQHMQRQLQQQQQQQWNAQRTLPLDAFGNSHVNPALIASRTVYPVTNL